MREAIWKSQDNERLSIWNGSFAMVSMSIVNGFVGMYLLDALNATNEEMGLLNSLPSLVNLFSMLAAALWIRRAHSKKWLCVWATCVSRSFYLWMALVPLLGVGNPALCVVWLVALTRVPQSLGDLSWQALISDLIPADRRSAFFSERNRVMVLVGMVVTFATGLVLQQFDKHLAWPYQAAFLATALFSAGEVWLLIRHDESQAPAPEVSSGASASVMLRGVAGMRHMLLWRALTNAPFRRAALALLFFNFAWQLSWPLFSIYQIRTAHAPAMWMALFAVANSASQVMTFRWWGRMADRWGNIRMLGVAALGMAFAPVLTILSTNLHYLFVVNIVTGPPLAGIQLLLFNALLEVCPEEERTAYIAYYNVALSVVGFIAPEVGVWLLDGIGLSGGMLASALLRVAGGLLFLALARRPASRRAAEHRVVSG